MTPVTHLLALLCIALIAAGQVLFAFSAQALNRAGTYLDAEVALNLGGALAIYGMATLIWVALLQHVPLGRLYPYMALSFVLVALAGRYIFGEEIAPAQVAGVVLIASGLVVMSAS